MLNIPTPHEFLSLMKERNYEAYQGLNIVGFRDKNYIPDTFNDALAVYYTDSFGDWSLIWWPITTLPGKPSLLNPFNKKGCAILAEGQYKNAYAWGLHKGKYRALVQVAPVKVYRDNNKDSRYDFSGELDTGLFGINIHKAGLFSKLVGVSSAGCQVFQKAADFDAFIKHCDWVAPQGRPFTYTLIEI